MLLTPAAQLLRKRSALTLGFLHSFLIIAVFLVYSGIFPNGFVYDDDFLIVKNTFLRSWHYLPTLFSTTLSAGANADGSYYRPLQSVLYLIVYQLAGPSTLAFHLLNISLHALATTSIFILGRTLGFSLRSSFWASLIWALHPLDSEAVSYMSATADPEHVFFIVTAIIILWPLFSRPRWLRASPFIMAALFSKESAVCFPLLVMSCLYYENEKRFDLTSYWKTWPAIAFVLGYIFIHFALPLHGLPPSPHSHSPTISYTPLASIPLYLHIFFWPTHLHMQHDLLEYPSLLNLPVIVGLGTILFAVLWVLQPQSSKTLPLSWGLLWFVAALLPDFYNGNVAFEHWLYLPSAGLLLGGLESIDRFLLPSSFLKRSYLLSIIYFVLASTLGLLTWQQNKVWFNTETLFQNVIENDQPAIKAHINLGTFYAQRGLYSQAIPYFQYAVDASHDTTAEAQHDLGICLLALNDGADHTEEALSHFKRALEINPNFYLTLKFLADFYDKNGAPTEAEIYKTRAQKLLQYFKTRDPS